MAKPVTMAAMMAGGVKGAGRVGTTVSLEARSGLDERDYADGELLGYVNDVSAVGVRSTPRVSGLVAARLRLALADERAEVMAGLLHRWPSVDWAKRFAGGHKIVAGENGVDAVVQRFPGIGPAALRDMGYAAEEALGEYVTQDEAVRREVALERQVAAEQGRERRARTYQLSQFLHDAPVRQKFGMDDAFTAVVSRHAVDDAAKAARVLQRYLHTKGHTEAIVVPGEYAQGGKVAKRFIMQAARPFGALQASVAAVVVGDRLFVDGPTDLEGRPEWTIAGPLDAGDVVMAVHNMAAARGAAAVVSLFTSQLIRLGIEVIEPKPLFGYVDPCVGEQGVQRGLGSGLEPPAELVDMVVPVMVKDVVYASAVRVSVDMCIVNKHVLSRLGVDSVRVMGMSVKPVRDCGGDLVVVAHDPVPCDVSLDFRTCERGERVAVLYAVGGYEVEVSDGMEVLSVEPGAVTSARARQVQKGLSGALVYALSDGAPVGVLFGAAVSTAVTHVPYGLYPDQSRESVGVVSDPVDGNRLYAAMKARGLAVQLRSVASALVPLAADGEHVATGFAYAGGVQSTQGGRGDPVRLPDGRVCEDLGRGLGGFSRFQRAGLEYDGVVRDAVPGEDVTLMGKDGGGDVFLSLTVRVVGVRGHVIDLAHPGATPYALAGAVVVGVRDGAVLGMVDATPPPRASVGALCAYSLVPVAVAVNDFFAVIGRESGFSLGAWARRGVCGLMVGDMEVIEAAAVVGYSVARSVRDPGGTGGGAGGAVGLDAGGFKQLRDLLGARVGLRVPKVQLLAAFVGIALDNEPVTKVKEFLMRCAMGTETLRPASWVPGGGAFSASLARVQEAIEATDVQHLGFIPDRSASVPPWEQYSTDSDSVAPSRSSSVSVSSPVRVATN